MPNEQQWRRTRLAIGALAVSAAVVGCARHQDRAATATDSVTTTGGSVAGAATTATPPAAEPEVTPASLTLGDIDLYQRALTARIEMVKRMRQTMAQSKSATDSLRAMNTVSAESADSGVARAAGTTPAHVGGVVKTVGDILLTMQGQGMTNAAGSQMDTANMTPEARATARQVLAELHQRSDSDLTAATAGMSPAVVAALHQRRSSLDSLRTAAMKLAFGQ